MRSIRCHNAYRLLNGVHRSKVSSSAVCLNMDDDDFLVSYYPPESLANNEYLLNFLFPGG